jgi:ribosomal-protein-alanine N-acetyltransferase
VERREDSIAVGHCGLRYSDADPRRWAQTFDAIELGYALLPEFRGLGYATESGRAVLEAAFASFDVPNIRGRCDVDNAASERVLERCGMTELRRDRQIHFEIARGHL